MADTKTMVLICLTMAVTLVACASASSAYFNYPSNYPIVFFSDFKYIPTDDGYRLYYRTQAGVAHEEIGLVPGVAPLRNSGNNGNGNGAGGNGNGGDDSNPDTLGSSRAGRQKSNRIPVKSRKVSPKLLASLSG